MIVVVAVVVVVVVVVVIVVVVVVLVVVVVIIVICSTYPLTFTGLPNLLLTYLSTYHDENQPPPFEGLNHLGG